MWTLTAATIKSKQVSGDVGRNRAAFECDKADNDVDHLQEGDRWLCHIYEDSSLRNADSWLEERQMMIAAHPHHSTLYFASTIMCSYLLHMWCNSICSRAHRISGTEGDGILLIPHRALICHRRHLAPVAISNVFVLQCICICIAVYLYCNVFVTQMA